MVVDSAVVGFIISEPGFCSVLLCWLYFPLLRFGLILVLFLGWSGSSVLVGFVSAVGCWKIAQLFNGSYLDFIKWVIVFVNNGQ